MYFLYFFLHASYPWWKARDISLSSDNFVNNRCNQVDSNQVDSWSTPRLRCVNTVTAAFHAVEFLSCYRESRGQLDCHYACEKIANYSRWRTHPRVNCVIARHCAFPPSPLIPPSLHNSRRDFTFQEDFWKKVSYLYFYFFLVCKVIFERIQFRDVKIEGLKWVY